MCAFGGSACKLDVGYSFVVVGLFLCIRWEVWLCDWPSCDEQKLHRFESTEGQASSGRNSSLWPKRLETGQLKQVANRRPSHPLTLWLWLSPASQSGSREPHTPESPCMCMYESGKTHPVRPLLSERIVTDSHTQTHTGKCMNLAWLLGEPLERLAAGEHIKRRQNENESGIDFVLTGRPAVRLASSRVSWRSEAAFRALGWLGFWRRRSLAWCSE